MLVQNAVLAAVLLASSPSALQRGRAAFEARQFSTAIEQLRRAVRENPSNPQAHLYLARALIEVGAIREALEHVQSASSNTADAEAQFEAGQILQRLATARYRQLRHAAPDSPEVDELSGRRFELDGRLSDALAMYRSAARKDPARTGIHFLIGNILWRQRDLAAAESELRLELDRNPFHGLANLRLGEVLLAQDRPDQAIPILERAASAMPTVAAVHRELGKAYRKAGRIEDAVRQWETVAATNATDDQIHFLLGTAYKDLGRAEEARRELNLHRAILARRRSNAEKTP